MYSKIQKAMEVKYHYVELFLFKTKIEVLVMQITLPFALQIRNCASS